MPNGRNAGRLFPDCVNEYGFGEYHVLEPLPFYWLRRLLGKETHVCRYCGRTFTPEPH